MEGQALMNSETQIASDLAALRRSGRWRRSETAFWLFVAACFFLFPDYLALGTQVLIIGLFALSLDLILGYAGLVTLGHAAFFGTGAYIAAWIALAGWKEPISGLVIAGAVSALLGYLASHLIRGRDLTLLMVTLGMGMLLYEGANKASSITGGVDGLAGFEYWPLLGIFSFDLEGRVSYIYAFVVLFLLFLGIRRIVHSPFGLVLRGLRDNPKRVSALGVNLRARLTVVYTIAAGFAGVAGALLTQTSQFVGLEVLSFQRSADVLIMLVMGGAGMLYGGLVGAAVFLLAQDRLAGINPQYWLFWLGAILVLVVLFVPGGLLGGLKRLQRLAQRDKRRND
jgi:branched-chain amino acid transport system permease protein